MKAILIAITSLLLSLQASALPNVMLVLLDDGGVDVVHVYDPGTWNMAGPTPVLDALATTGIKGNHVYVNSNCSPTRATIISGTDAFRHGIGNQIDVQLGVNSFGPGESKAALVPSRMSLPRALRAVGYNVAAVGKWHLAAQESDYDIASHPARVGFNQFAGLMSQANVSPILGISAPGYSNYEWVVNGFASRQTAYLTTAEVDEAIAQKTALTALGSPWFIYLALNAPHDPFHCPPVTGSHGNTLHTFGATCSPGDIQTDFRAAMQAADTEIGRLIATINFATTVLIVMFDNGTAVNVVAGMTGTPFVSAHAKGSVFDGGLHVPFFVRGVGVAAGTATNALIGAADIPATILDLAGTSSPAFIDGVSFKPLLASPSGNTIRTTAFGQRFLPNGQPAVPNAAIKHDRGVYGCTTPACTTVEHLMKTDDLNYVYYEVSADPFETAPLATAASSAICDDVALSAIQARVCHDLLPQVNLPESSPTGASHHHGP